MTDKELIGLLEKATGLELDEQGLASLIDDRLAGVLKAASPRTIGLGAEAPGPRVGLSRFLGDVRRLGMGQAPRHASAEELVTTAGGMKELSPAKAKDLREGATTAGGFLAPVEQAGEVLNLVKGYSAVKGLCRQVPMTAHQITFPTVSGGLTAYWVPEASDTEGVTPDGTGQASGEKPRSDATFGQLALTAHVLAVKVVVSNQLLDDSDPGVDQVLRTLFAETIGQAFDVAALRGAGTATDPITGLAGRISTNALSVGSELDFDDIAELIYAVYQNAPHAAEVPVLGHPKAEKQVMSLTDSGGNPIFRRPSVSADEADPRPRLWGEPFVRDPNILTNLGTSTTDTRLFAGDFASSALVGVRQGLVVKTNPWAEPYFSYNQTAFLAEVRIGFALADEARFAMLSDVPTA
jgi:HK97 family phage major capsid protein